MRINAARIQPKRLTPNEGDREDVMYQLIEDGIGQGRIADNLWPAGTQPKTYQRRWKDFGWLITGVHGVEEGGGMVTFQAHSNLHATRHEISRPGHPVSG